jgi:hypothetical protein
MVRDVPAGQQGRLSDQYLKNLTGPTMQLMTLMTPANAACSSNTQQCKQQQQQQR